MTIYYNLEFDELPQIIFQTFQSSKLEIMGQGNNTFKFVSVIEPVYLLRNLKKIFTFCFQPKHWTPAFHFFNWSADDDMFKSYLKHSKIKVITCNIGTDSDKPEKNIKIFTHLSPSGEV